MPELPDVEGFRRVLATHAVGRRIKHVDVLDDGVLRNVNARTLEAKLRGRSFEQPRRHGKWLITPVRHAGVMMLHFGMTGMLCWVEPRQDRHRDDRVVFAFDDGELRYRDLRKLRGLWLTDDENEVLADVGPDAAEISADELRDLLAKRHRQVKAALIDQSVVAGIGNLLADEILWRARVHPRLPCHRLARGDFGRLDRARRSVLRQSIAKGRVPPHKSWLTGRRDDPSGSCPRCGTTLAHDRIGGRSTTWCPHCQPS
ncbi:Fpg/Nei family DNA glycosylase [Fodinicola acaciae]|uniref:Fpg/Nei family DNA glycosylase n=1 Tax=Fodinicola acaciae TaxID=2681555 RepID=UPI0013D7ADBA|nr:DNA-formamidopyrimidine glycosylase family protein [Fodinicola acaciae]